VDLFAAIFGNTDSEDSDEEEEADNQSHDMETTNPSVPTTQGIYCVPSWIFNVMVMRQEIYIYIDIDIYIYV
jgi:hypothetical protein